MNTVDEDSSGTLKRIALKGMHLNHDWYVVVGKQYHTENAYAGHNTISLYTLTNFLLLFICFKIVLSF